MNHGELNFLSKLFYFYITHTLILSTRLTEYEACERLSRDLQSQLVLRNREPKLSNEYSRLSATIRVRLNQFSSELDQLSKKLEQSQRSYTLTSEEAERRQRQIELLKSKLIQLQKQFSDVGGTTNRTNLLASGSRLWEGDDDDDIPVLNDNYSIGDLRKEQTRILEDQNEGLDALSRVISRQKELAIQIGDEVDIQNDIIDELGDAMEHTDSRINSETRHIGIVDRKDKTCGYYMVIGSLFIAIVVISLL